MVFAADASTLILLAKAELLLPAADDYTFYVPPAVKEECLAQKTWDALMIASLLEAGKIKIGSAGKSGSLKSLSRDFGLHRGEAEAIELAAREKLPLAVDDYAAIKACRVLRIAFATAIHFLIALRKNGRFEIAAAEAKLEKLAHYGRYSSRILQDAVGRIRGEV